MVKYLYFDLITLAVANSKAALRVECSLVAIKSKQKEM